MYGEPSSSGGMVAWPLSRYLCVGLVSEEILSTESGRYMMRACVDGLFLVADSLPDKHVGKVKTPYGDYRIEIEGDQDYDAMRDDMRSLISNYKKAAEAGR